MSTKHLAGLAVNKSILKEFSTSEFMRTVYMKNGTEFQICLFNPEKYPIGVEISINGDDLKNMLVINPGQRVWLERYLNESRKFKFETYDIEDTAEAKNAVSLNGEIKLKFYRKKSEPKITVSYSKPTWIYQPSVYYSSTIDTATATNTVNTKYAKSLNLNENCMHVNTVSASANTLGCQSVKGFTSTSSCDSYDCANTALSTSVDENKTIETGRVGRGQYSSQKFDYVDIDFESWPYQTEVINILSESRKVATAADFNKKYCYNCGKKLNPKFKYCPVCGTKVE